MSKEAMKLALEALKQIDEAMPFPVAKLAQAALREALAQKPAQQDTPPPCPTCEALARTVMLDQTSHDAQRKPLTDEQIEALLVNWPEDGIAFFEFARAIEAAHGIKEKNT